MLSFHIFESILVWLPKHGKYIQNKAFDKALVTEKLHQIFN